MSAITEKNPGRIVVEFGPMHSGKTTAMVEQLRISEGVLHRHAIAVKPLIDDRGEGLEKLKAKGGNDFPAVAVPTYKPEMILDLLEQHPLVIGVDEAQFFTPGIIGVVEQIASSGVDVLVAGLPTDFLGQPFGSMPDLIAIADEAHHHTAYCTHVLNDGDFCRQRATMTQRLVDGQPASRTSPLVLVGGQELYEARCRKHHVVPD